MWNDLTMAQKNELMQYYIRNGVTSLDSMVSRYNTFAKGGPKKSANRKTYNEWASAMASKYPWLELNSQRAGYDYERYFNENYEDAISRLVEDTPRHFTDRYKLPSHPTFSNESVYSTPKTRGGTWVGEDMFMPSAYNAERYPWLKPYKPVTEDYIYSFKDGGHLFGDGGPEDEEEVPPYNRALYNTVNPVWGYPGFWEAVRLRREAKNKVRNGTQDIKEYEIGNDIGSLVANEAFKKRLGIDYNSMYLPKFSGDTVRLPESVEREIPIDTAILKSRIQTNESLLKKYSPSSKRYKVVKAANDNDKKHLEALRKTYKTGEPVGVNEYSWNSRQLINGGEPVDLKSVVSPLNVLHNYNIRYDKPTNRMYYSDEYDFNQYEPFVPGEPFRIRGYIDLNKK